MDERHLCFEILYDYGDSGFVGMPTFGSQHTSELSGPPNRADESPWEPSA
jgi:hypothetical protein